MLKVVKADKANSIIKKSELLGLSLNEQLELLNKAYENELYFTYTDEEGLIRREDGYNIDVLCNIDILEIPEISYLRDINFYSTINTDSESDKMFKVNKVATVKIPKSIKEVSSKIATTLSGHCSRVFIYDNTDFNIEYFSHNSILNNKIEMLIVKNDKTGKAKIYRFN